MEVGPRARMGTNKVHHESRMAQVGAVLACLACSAMAFCAIAGAQTTGKTIRHHRVEEQNPDAGKLTEAENDINKQDYASAEPLLKQIVGEHPGNYAAWYDLGFIYRVQGRHDDSIAAYRKSVEAKPDVLESNLNLGLALADAGQPEAEQYLRAATKAQPMSDATKAQERAWMALGNFLQATKPNDALDAFRQAESADPKNPEPHLVAGSILEKLHPSEAEKEYQQALRIDPNSADAHAALANLYMRQRRFSEAEPMLRKLLAAHPNDAAAHFQLGRMLGIAGKKDDAIRALEAGLKLDPSDSKAQRDLADLYVDSAEYDEAEKAYGTLLASYPSDA